MSNRFVFYVGNFHFPNGNAAGKRVYGNAQLLNELGYKVVIIDCRKGVSPSLLEKDNFLSNDNIECFSLGYPVSFKDWLNTNKAFANIIECMKSYGLENIDFIFLYGSQRISFLPDKVRVFSQRNNIKVIADVVDLLSIKTSNPIRDVFKRLDELFQKNYFVRKSDGVVCISTYLSDKYKNKKCIIIPPISEYSIDYMPANEIRKILYAGKPFRQDMIPDDLSSLKDRIDIVFECLSKIKSMGYFFNFVVCGFEKEEVIKVLPSIECFINDLGDFVSFKGEISNENVINELKSSDYSILIRDDKIDSRAGFPSKIVESIVNGVPVLVSNVGDIRVYLKDREHGFLINNLDRNHILDVMCEALNCSREGIELMKNNCINNKSFFFYTYKTALSGFLKAL